MGKMKTYRGFKNGAGPGKVSVEENRTTTILDERPSQKIWNHSPDGFQWGYSGSGPAQLALAILLDLGVNKEIAIEIHQDFKWKVIATLPSSWVKTEFELMASVNEILFKKGIKCQTS
jgi:hypothetical protein